MKLRFYQVRYFVFTSIFLRLELFCSRFFSVLLSRFLDILFDLWGFELALRVQVIVGLFSVCNTASVDNTASSTLSYFIILIISIEPNFLLTTDIGTGLCCLIGSFNPFFADLSLIWHYIMWYYCCCFSCHYFLSYFPESNYERPIPRRRVGEFVRWDFLPTLLTLFSSVCAHRLVARTHARIENTTFNCHHVIYFPFPRLPFYFFFFSQPSAGPFLTTYASFAVFYRVVY